MRLLDIAYVLFTEGIPMTSRSEADQQIEKFGLDVMHPKMRQRRLEATWGETPEAIQGQETLMRFLGMGPVDG